MRQRVRARVRHTLLRAPWAAPLIVPAAAWWLRTRGLHELRLLDRLVDRDRLSVDVGASIGIYSYVLSRLTPGVVAYEPNSEVTPFLRAGARSNVKVVEVALSDRSGKAVLSVPELAGAPRDTRGSIASAPSDGRWQSTVETKRLDDEGLGGVGFIKIDVEGHEAEVLAGAMSLIERDRPALLVEIEEERADHSVQDVAAPLVELGYTAQFIVRGALRPLAEFCQSIHQRISPDGHPIGDFANGFVFTPRAL